MNRTHYMIRSGMIVVIAAGALCAATRPHPSSAAAPRAAQEQDDNFPKIDWRHASPGAVLAVAFEAIGYDGPKAIEMADNELRRLGLSENQLNPQVASLDWKNSTLHTILYDAFMVVGFRDPDLMALTNLAYQKVTGQTLISQPSKVTSKIVVYPMYLIYADAEGRRHQIKAWTRDECIDRLYKSDCADRIPNCKARGVAWLKVHRSDADPFWGPTAGSPVYLRWSRSEAYILVPDLIETRHCNLFVELDPIDCDAIEYFCGDWFMGPPGGLDGR